MPDMTPWQDEITFERYVDFLSHDFNNPSRVYVCKLLRGLTKSMDGPKGFVEVGFGQCLDFGKCFRELHDKGRIIYAGFDITEQFVIYARKLYPGYDFRLGQFSSLMYSMADIVYTRHTLEHQPPEEMEACLRKLLAASRDLCIITWFVPPKAEEKLQQLDNQGFGGAPAWVNQYGKQRVAEIITGENFSFTGHQCGEDEIYICERSLQ
jgi:hypothetical protein